MNQFPTTSFLFLCKFSLVLGLFSACGNSESQTLANAPMIEEGIPSELDDAKWVFESDQGIFIQKSNQPEARLLVEGAKWPRFGPNGDVVAFLRGNEVCLITLDTKEIQVLAETSTPKTLVVTASGEEIWFSEGKEMKAVKIDSGEIRSLVNDGEFLEVDAGPDGKTLLATVKSLGFRVKWFDLSNNTSKTLDKGCSASLSPDGFLATNNVDGHKRLAILNVNDGSLKTSVLAPQGIHTDNQFWSNHADWIASIDEDAGHILAHRVSDGKVWKLSNKDGGDRPDLWIP